MLVFPLKKVWFEKIKSGEKTVEYREVKPYWTGRLRTGTRDNFDITSIGDSYIFSPALPSFRPKCILRLGYTKRQMTADITKIEVVDGKDTDLRMDKPVYAIHLAKVREEIKECGSKKND